MAHTPYYTKAEADAFNSGIRRDYDADVANLYATSNTGVYTVSLLSDLNFVGEANVSYKVIADPVSNNNGYYTWASGTTFNKDAPLYDTVVTSGSTNAVTSEGVKVAIDVLESNLGDLSSTVATKQDLNIKKDTPSYVILANGSYHAHISTPLNLFIGDVVKFNLVGEVGIKYDFQVRTLAAGYPVLLSDIVSNTDYELVLTEDIDLFGFTERSTNLVSGNAYLSLEVYNNISKNIYEQSINIGDNSANITITEGNLQGITDKIIVSTYDTLINSPRQGFTVVNSENLDYVDKAFKTIEFYPFYSNIKEVDINFITVDSVATTPYIQFNYTLTTDRNIKYSQAMFITSVDVGTDFYWKEELYGLFKFEVDYNYLISNPVKKFKASLKLLGSLDTSDTFLGDMDFYDLGQKEWVPTINSGMLESLSSGGNIFVDNQEGYTIKKYGLNYDGVYWDALQPTNSTTIDSTVIDSAVSESIAEGLKKGLLILPTTLPSASGNSVVVGSDTIYYNFPTWLYTLIMAQTDGDVGVHKPTVGDVVDYQTGSTIKVYFLDYRDALTTSYFQNAVDLLFTYFHSDAQGIINYKYIEYIKVGLFGTWGEGSSHVWDNIPPSDTLIDTSDYIINKFTDRVCILPMASALSPEYPTGYRDYLVSANNGTKDFGLFLDSGGQYADRYRQDSQFIQSYWDLIYRLHETVPIYLESFQFLPIQSFYPTEPIFRTLLTQILNFRPNWFSTSNLFFGNNAANDVNTIDMLKRVSHFVGTKLYLLSNRTSYSLSSDELEVWFTLGNMGTSKIYFDYWKLKVTLNDGVNSESQILTFDLKNVRSGFKVGEINWRDTSEVIQTLSLANTYVPETLTVTLEIIDNDAVSPNLYINKSSSYILLQ